MKSLRRLRHFSIYWYNYFGRLLNINLRTTNMNRTHQLVLGGSGSDIFLSGFRGMPKVIRNKNTRQSFWMKRVEGDFVILEPTSGSEISIPGSALTTESWEVIS